MFTAVTPDMSTWSSGRGVLGILILFKWESN
jgi:hypothetical protein